MIPFWHACRDLVGGLVQMRRLKQALYDQHFGHHRVIAREEGLPVRSLFVPAERSTTMTAAQARWLIDLRYGRISPILASLALTNDCPCRCDHCGFIDQGLSGALSTATWTHIITALQDLGFSTLLFSGGEPLQRPDLEELIAHVDRERSIPVLVTCGHGLVERLPALHAAGLRRVMVSIDHADAMRHDANRHRPGLHAAAIAGIAAARRLGLLVGLSTWASPERLADGSLDGILTLGRELRVHEVEIYEQFPIGRSRAHQLGQDERRAFAHALRQWVDEVQSRRRYPAIWSYQRMRSLDAGGCSSGRTYLRVTADGRIVSCDFHHRVWGNAVTDDLADIWSDMQLANRCRAPHRCQAMTVATGRSRQGAAAGQ